MTQPRADLVTTVLIVDDQEWTSRSVESILRPRGYAVLKAYTGQQALEVAGRVTPDLAIVDFHLPDMHGIEVVRELRSRGIVDPTTPLLMMSSSGIGRAERMEALGAGAWDTFRHPLDPGELILRIENLVQAKHVADRLRREIMTDMETGLYNLRGVLRRAKEIGADSVRFGRTVACIAVGPAWAGEGPGAESGGHAELPLADFIPAAAHALRAAVRESDAVGQMGPLEFVIVASGLDQVSATRLADRILQNLERTPRTDVAGFGGHAELPLRAGVYVTPREDAVDAEHLLSRATIALRKAQGTNGNFKVRSFEA
ncbi:MAG: response regulator [Gemmatimonadetes bacterium]|nr:response regulator [Gemmatimonadota bacterium]